MENKDISNLLNNLKNEDENNGDKSSEIIDTNKKISAQELGKIIEETSNKKAEIIYPKELSDTTLERRFIGLLLNEIKAISMYYFVYDECYFADNTMGEIYKKILFTDGEKYAPGIAKEKFNFSRESQEMYELKNSLQQEFENSKYKLEDTYRELKKIFILRKNYLGIPVKEIQIKIADIVNYELYDKMTPEDIKDAVNQVTVTQKFRRAILNNHLTDFVIEGDNTLTNGLSLPFPILTKSFKGIRQGETASFAMPSNYGKSRFTINLAAYLAIVHEKKILIISNEMSEEKMKLCLITTILNNPIIQQIHGKKLHVSENQLLDFRFRPDKGKEVPVDEGGFMTPLEGESHADFARRIKDNSTEFNDVLKVTNWFNEKLYNSIHFIDITDHTNDELKKVIMNYYYKEKVHYVFYDTMKTDIENIGNGEELKKTATILSNLAQNFGMYIGSTLQLRETETDPVNLSVADMAVSRTVKEVLDTLALFKQIPNNNLSKYEYSFSDTFDETKEIERFNDPDVRYYSCVVDKNRAGPKPVLLFRINLAYNSWEELGYLRLK